MSSRTTTIANTRTQVWRDRLGSALRTTLACTIVGCTSLYAPQPLRRYLDFPAFSYVTTILIVSDANLGDTVRGCWHVLCATLQVMAISTLTLSVIGPHAFNNHVAAVAVAAGSFLVALPESSDLLTKRIAFGQLVIVYVSTVIRGAAGVVSLYPIQVACSTALGAVASLLAMLLPYPRLAHSEARKFCRLYTENSSERLNCNIEAISASENSTAVDFINKAKSISTLEAKLLKSIKSNLDGMHWERPNTRIFNPHCIELEQKLQDLRVTIRGMDIALSSCTSFPVDVIDEELRGVLLNCRGIFRQKLEQQDKSFAAFDATTTTENKKEILNKNLSIACKDLPISFFLYCVQLLLDNSPISKETNHEVEKAKKSNEWSCEKIREVAMNFVPSKHSFAFAFKCSLSLGLAVLFGLTYNKVNGYWSGLTIAISFETGRQPTFSVANARGQGTAMGSVYGVICCFLLQKFVDLRLLPLLPWVVFYTFLRHNRMYGQSGAISAVIGALIILGRKHYGPPSEFAIARLTEAVIGLLCLVIVEVLVSPSRAATLSKSELSQCLRALQDCIGGIANSFPREKDMASSSSQALRERQKKLKSLMHQLEKFIAEAELEPSFWFLPFHGACYHKLLESLSRIVDLLLFVAYSMENITQLSQKGGGFLVDLQDQVNGSIEIFKNKVGPTLKCLEEITRMKSLRELEKELKNRNLPCDIESGEYPNADTFRTLTGDEEVHSITRTFIQHLEEMASKTHTNRDEEILKGQMVLHYSCLGFCTSRLGGEITKIENEVKELLMWENPSCQANMKEIYCKISALHSC